MRLKYVFWRYASRRYGSAEVPPGFEYAMYGWIALVCLIFGYATVERFKNLQNLLPVGIVLCVVPLCLALLHLRIRKERAKGRNAITERMMAMRGKGRRRHRRG